MLEMIQSSDEATQRLRLAHHAQQVRTHMTPLGRKGYWDQFTPSPEFVVMFLPGEVFFSAALQEDPSLIEFGVNEKVIAATPTTLIALLRAVAYGWRQEALAQNAQEVAKLGKDLYDRITTLGEHWANVGERLGKAVEACNKSTTTLESRVLVSARRLRDLKVGAEDGEIAQLEQVEMVPRVLQAAEIAETGAGGAVSEANASVPSINHSREAAISS
jgi:DNA recombination protein RmuC